MVKIRLGKLLYATNLPSQVMRKVRLELTVPNPAYDTHMRLFGRRPYHLEPNLHFYQNRHNAIITPRGFWGKLRKLLLKAKVEFIFEDKRTENSWTEEITSNIKARKYQTDNVTLAIDHEQATIIVPAGGGKTEIGLEIITQVKQNALVLVHTNALLQQWIRRVRDSLGYDPGVIQGKTFEVKQITIAMVQTLTRRILDKGFYEYFGLVLIDEAHHCPASTFERVIQHFPARYRFGVTADAKRTDGMESMLYAVCGDPINLVDTNDLIDQGYIMRPTIIPVHTRIKVDDSMLGEWHALVRKVTLSRQRNNIIISIIEKELKEDNKILVLSERKEHLYILYNRLRESVQRKSAVIESSLPRKNIEHSLDLFNRGKIKILFATQIADEGLNIPSINRIILSFPGKSRSRVIQRVGRSQRIFEGKKDAIIYDLIDIKIKTLKNQYLKRRQVYKSLGFKIGQKFQLQ